MRAAAATRVVALGVLLLVAGRTRAQPASSPRDGSRAAPPVAPEASPPPAAPADPGWIVSPAQALVLLRERGALLLDARGPAAWRTEQLDGARPVRWEDLARGEQRERGHLLANDGDARAYLERQGIGSDRTVLVVGDPVGGWGEEGRLVWALRSLGHGAAALVDGGHAALAQAGWELVGPEAEAAAAAAPRRGRFSPRRVPTWTVEADELRRLLALPPEAADRPLLIDTREPREYSGATPYGEPRGGHLPGAVPLHYRELLGADGRLRSRAALQTRLRRAGLRSPAQPVVVYCTGGVRSAWTLAVLRHLGYASVRNYAGSTWEWAAGSPQDFPLTTAGSVP